MYFLWPVQNLPNINKSALNIILTECNFKTKLVTELLQFTESSEVGKLKLYSVEEKNRAFIKVSNKMFYLLLLKLLDYERLKKSLFWLDICVFTTAQKLRIK